MPFDVTEAIEALAGALKKGFSCAESFKKRQSEAEIIKFAREKIKAIDIAERIIVLCYNYYSLFSLEDKKEFSSLFEKFLEHN